ncbi:hypothetical protein [Cupriavidus oxalaticus]
MQDQTRIEEIAEDAFGVWDIEDSTRVERVAFPLAFNDETPFR